MEAITSCDMEIYDYKISHTPQLVKSNSNILSPTERQSVFKLNSEIGKGYTESYQLNDGLSVQISKFECFEPLKIIRSGTLNENLLVLDFHVKGIGNLNLNASVDDIPIASQFNFGAYFAHSKIESSGVFPANSNNEQLHLIIDKNWLFNEYSDQLKELFGKVSIEGSFFIFERLSPKVVKVIHEVMTSDTNSEFRRLYLKGKAFELLTLFFRDLDKRTKDSHLEEVNSADVARLFELESYIKNNLKDDLSVSRLALKAGFSESKLQKLFKSVYGKSVHKKINEIKMIEALELLDSKNYSISQIGYEMGYHNMSHFSAAFRKIHGFLPSEY